MFEANECDLELFDSGTNSVLILILLDFEFPMILSVVDMLEVVNQLLRGATSCSPLSILESRAERGASMTERKTDFSAFC